MRPRLNDSRSALAFRLPRRRCWRRPDSASRSRYPPAPPPPPMPPESEPLPEIVPPPPGVVVDPDLEPQVTITQEGRRDRRGSARQRQAHVDQGHAAPRRALLPGPGSGATASSFAATASTRASGFRCGCFSRSELISLHRIPARSGAPRRAALPDVGLHARLHRRARRMAAALCGRARSSIRRRLPPASRTRTISSRRPRAATC